MRFLGDEFEGREEWVPPTRLKTTWDKVDEWVAEDSRWQAIYEDTRNWGDPELEAAEDVITQTIPRELAYPGFNRNVGLLFIEDISGLVRHLDLDIAILNESPASFQMKDDTWVVPFSVMLRIARRAASIFADKVFEHVEQDEQKARFKNIHGSSHGGEYIPPEICAKVDETYAPARQLVREWCGKEAAAHVAELAALREEVFRLGKLIEKTISLLRDHDSATAEALQRELGIPIETLRKAQRRAD